MRAVRRRPFSFPESVFFYRRAAFSQARDRALMIFCRAVLRSSFLLFPAFQGAARLPSLSFLRSSAFFLRPGRPSLPCVFSLFRERKRLFLPQRRTFCRPKAERTFVCEFGFSAEDRAIVLPRKLLFLFSFARVFFFLAFRYERKFPPAVSPVVVTHRKGCGYEYNCGGYAGICSCEVVCEHRNEKDYADHGAPGASVLSL